VIDTGPTTFTVAVRFENPLALAVIVVEPAPTGVTAKPTLWLPARMRAVPGTVATLGLLEDNVNVTADIACDDRLIVSVPPLPPRLRLRGFGVRVAAVPTVTFDVELPSPGALAVIVT